MTFTACDSPSREGATNIWFTPARIIDLLDVDFDLDPCSHSCRPFRIADRTYCEDELEDGLFLPWFGRVWLNPPYGREIGDWLSRLAEHGNGIALVFNRLETKWGQEAAMKADAINFMEGRVKFLKRDGKEASNAGTGSVLLAFGENNVLPLLNVPGVVFHRGVGV